MTNPEILRYTQETGDFSRMLESIPYARFIGLECDRYGDDLIFRLPKKEENLGNPILPAIHGGVISISAKRRGSMPTRWLAAGMRKPKTSPN